MGELDTDDMISHNIKVLSAVDHCTTVQYGMII